MRYRVVFYCPDHHIRYDLRTLERAGVGGGITSRVRIAHALAGRGHRVRMFVNCPREGRIGRVEYRHFSSLDRVEADVFVFGTSAAELDLGLLQTLDVRARLRVLMTHGTRQPAGLDISALDQIYAPSDFLRGVILREWEAASIPVFVTHRGVSARPRPAGTRDPRVLAYAGHPSKGLQPAIAVHRRLRERDPRFELHVFGGAGLWGEAPGAALLAPGVIDHGLVGQRKLARQLEACSFSLNLQTRLEPFGMVVTEAMRAGCVVIASPVGAYPELIRHGHDGFLVEGDPREIETQDRAAQLIASLAEAPQTLRQLRAAAAMRPLTWEQVAQAWEGHWDWLLAGRPPPGQSASPCPECGGAPLLLADGLHCPACGRYQLTPAPGSA